MDPDSAPRLPPILSIASPDGGICADIVPELGGIVSSLRFRGRECLFRHPWFWDPLTPETRGGIPVLFPACGRLLSGEVPGQYEIDHKPYVLPIHGWAMRLPWKIAEARPDSLRLRLDDSPRTRSSYPFPFLLDLRFTASADAFTCRLAVLNTGERPMPYAAGFHPYFRIPPPGAGKEQTLFEATAHQRFLYNPTRTDVVGTAPLPDFPMSVAEDAVNGLLLEAGDLRESTIRLPDGGTIRQTASPLFRFRQFYTLPGEGFFCDEPWTAPSGALNRPASVRHLPPHQSDFGSIQIRFLPPSACTPRHGADPHRSPGKA